MAENNTAGDVRSIINRSTRGIGIKKGMLPTKDSIQSDKVEQSAAETTSSVAKSFKQSDIVTANKPVQPSKNPTLSSTQSNTSSPNISVDTSNLPPIKQPEQPQFEQLQSTKPSLVGQVSEQLKDMSKKAEDENKLKGETFSKGTRPTGQQGSLFRATEQQSAINDRVAGGIGNLLSYVSAANQGGQGVDVESLMASQKFRDTFKGLDDTGLQNLIQDVSDLSMKGNISDDDLVKIVNAYPELGAKINFETLSPDSRAKFYTQVMNGEEGGLADAIDNSGLIQTLYPTNLVENIVRKTTGLDLEGSIKATGERADKSKHKMLDDEGVENILQDNYEYQYLQKQKKILDKIYDQYRTENVKYHDENIPKMIRKDLDKLHDEYYNMFGFLKNGKTVEDYQKAAQKIEDKYLIYGHDSTGDYAWSDKEKAKEYEEKMSAITNREEELKKEVKKEHGDTGKNLVWNKMKNTLKDGIVIVSQAYNFIDNPAKSTQALVEGTVGLAMTPLEGYYDLYKTGKNIYESVKEGDFDYKNREIEAGGVDGLVKQVSGGDFNSFSEFADTMQFLASQEDATIEDKVWGGIANMLSDSKENQKAFFTYLNEAYFEEGALEKSLHKNPLQVLSDIVSLAQANNRLLREAGILSPTKMKLWNERLGQWDAYERAMGMGMKYVEKVGKLEGKVVGSILKGPSKIMNKALSKFVDTGKLTDNEKGLIMDDFEGAKKSLKDTESSFDKGENLKHLLETTEDTAKNTVDTVSKIAENGADMTKGAITKLKEALFNSDGELKEGLANKMNHINSLVAEAEEFIPGLGEKVKDLATKQTIEKLGENMANSSANSMLGSKYTTLGALFTGNPGVIATTMLASLGSKMLMTPQNVVRLMQREAKTSKEMTPTMRNIVSKMGDGRKLSSNETKIFKNYIKGRETAMGKLANRLEQKGIIKESLSEQSSDIDKYNASLKSASGKFGDVEKNINLSENERYTGKQKADIKTAGYGVDTEAKLGEGELGRTNYADKIVELAEQSGDRTPAHEAFHAMFSAVDKETQQAILAKAKKILRQKLKIDVTDDMASEFLAESYGIYEKRKSIDMGILEGDKSLEGKMRNLFQKTYEFMQNAYGDRKTINKLFEQMSEGWVKEGTDLTEKLGTKRSPIQKFIDSLGEASKESEIGSQGMSFKQTPINPNAKSIDDMTYKDGNTLKIKSYISEASKQFNETAPKELQGVVGTHFSEGAMSEFAVPEGYMFYHVNANAMKEYKNVETAKMMKDSKIDMYKDLGLSSKELNELKNVKAEKGTTKETPTTLGYNVLFGNMKNTKIIDGGGRLRYEGVAGYSDLGIDLTSIKEALSKEGITNKEVLNVLKEKGGNNFESSLAGERYDLGGGQYEYLIDNFKKNGKANKSDVNALIRAIDRIENGKSLSTDLASRVADGLGYDSIYFKDIIDAAPNQAVESAKAGRKENLRGGVVVTFKDNQAKSLMNANPTKEGGFAYKKKGGLAKKSGKTTKKGLSTKIAKYQNKD